MIECYYCKKEIKKKGELVYATQPWLNSKPYHDRCYDDAKENLSSFKGPGAKIMKGDIVKNMFSPIVLLIISPILFVLILLESEFPDVGSLTIPVRIMLFTTIAIASIWALMHLSDMGRFRKQLEKLNDP